MEHNKVFDFIELFEGNTEGDLRGSYTPKHLPLLLLIFLLQPTNILSLRNVNCKYFFLRVSENKTVNLNYGHDKLTVEGISYTYLTEEKSWG